jgi:hypothetical protein
MQEDARDVRWRSAGRHDKSWRCHMVLYKNVTLRTRGKVSPLEEDDEPTVVSKLRRYRYRYGTGTHRH